MKYWISGVCISELGLVLARILAPRFGEPAQQAGAYAAGALLAFLGLAIILLGLSRKYKSKANPVE